MCIVPNYFHLTQPIKILPQDNLTANKSKRICFTAQYSSDCVRHSHISAVGAWTVAVLAKGISN